jgi:hypothetical protein
VNQNWISKQIHEFRFFTEGNEVNEGALRAAWLCFYDSLAGDLRMTGW